MAKDLETVKAYKTTDWGYVTKTPADPAYKVMSFNANRKSFVIQVEPGVVGAILIGPTSSVSAVNYAVRVNSGQYYSEAGEGLYMGEVWVKVLGVSTNFTFWERE